LYLSLEADALELLAHELSEAGVEATWDADELLVDLAGSRLRFVHAMSPSNVRTRLSREYVSFVLVEARPGASHLSFDVRRRAIEDLIEELDHGSDVELRYGFHRIGLLISDEVHGQVEPMLLNLGAHGIRFAWRARSQERGFIRRALEAMSEAVRRRRVGKKALCLSGGGTTGVFFELGVLKCLQDCLPTGALNQMDMYFGISAGAVVTSVLAAGYTIDDFMGAIAGEASSRMPPLDLELVRRQRPFLSLAGRRLMQAAAQRVQRFGRSLVRRQSQNLGVLGTEYRSLWAPPFTAEGLEEYLRDVFERRAGGNRFEHLDRELYIGATDLDSRRHTLFGAEGAPPTTISQAVQASVSFNPVFVPVKIGRRFFEDGAVTRTSNMSEAIERGATLLFIVDPFVPRVSPRPGVHVARSLLYHVDQNIRTMSFTRFASARNQLVRSHPEVGIYAFLPSNRQRRLLADNPMDHRQYLPIWKAAYLATLARIERLGPKLAGDLSAHGLPLDLDRARSVARRLESKDGPTLADFQPQRRLRSVPTRANPSPAIARTASR
jgi:predicted acylesterase/phospholipase RssA